MTKKVIVPVANGSEELETITIVNILRRAGIEVVIFSKEEIVSCARGIKLIADINEISSIETNEYHGIVIPGGILGVQNLSTDNQIVLLIKEFIRLNKLVGAICAAPSILAERNLYPKDIKLTSHPSVKDKLQEYEYLDDAVVEYDNFITSRGAGTALDFSFAIVEYLLGEEVALKIKENILYNID